MSDEFSFLLSFTRVNVPKALLGTVQTLIGDWWTEQAARAANPEIDAAVTLSHMAPVKTHRPLKDHVLESKSADVMDVADTLAFMAPDMSRFDQSTLVKYKEEAKDDDDDDEDEDEDEDDEADEEDSDSSTVIGKRKRRAVSRFGAEPTIEANKKRQPHSFLDAADETRYRLDPKHLDHDQLHPFLITAKAKFGEESVTRDLWKALAKSVEYKKFSIRALTNRNKTKGLNAGRFFPYLIATSSNAGETRYRLHSNFLLVNTV